MRNQQATHLLKSHPLIDDDPMNSPQSAYSVSRYGAVQTIMTTDHMIVGEESARCDRCGVPLLISHMPICFCIHGHLAAACIC